MYDIRYYVILLPIIKHTKVVLLNYNRITHRNITNYSLCKTSHFRMWGNKMPRQTEVGEMDVSFLNYAYTS